ncbi:MAG: TatD family hydrolase [Desulfurella sp.]|uniref:TatD family hydrolase n=1 Tax=Desulfurella sp. TaxID=1962857 RepID=UPI003C7165E2
MKIIDTHAHLQSQEFDKIIDEVIKRFGVVEKVFLATSYISDIEKACKLTHNYENLYFFAGIHPHHAGEFKIGDLDIIESYLKDEKCIGIGEIGLDYFYNYAPKETQKILFSSLLDFAIFHNKWVSIHIRDAVSDSIDILSSKLDLKAIIHCFSGDFDLLKLALDRNYLLGIGGIVTFKNSLVRKNIKQVPLKNMVLETDSPYLAPVPKRGHTNEPSFLQYTLFELSNLLKLPPEEIAQITYENSLRVLNDK